MANEPHYACTRCGADTERKLLTVKKAVFLEMGEGARTLRSRVTAWLCPSCVAVDVDWNQPRFSPPRANRAPLVGDSNGS